MTRKHLSAIAAQYAQRMSNPTIPSEARQALIALANSQADLFEEWNPLFDRKKFLTACGIGV